jgi:hypothetical protein
MRSGMMRTTYKGKGDSVIEIGENLMNVLVVALICATVGFIVWSVFN